MTYATDAQKRAALEMGKTGLYSCSEIARETGVRGQTVKDICLRHNVRLPLGYGACGRKKGVVA